MNPGSVLGNVKIDPPTDGQFGWQGNTLIFTPTVGYQRGVVQKVVDILAAFLGFGGGVDQLVQVFQARFRFRGLLLLEHLFVAGSIQNETEQVGQPRRTGHQRQFLNQIAEHH